MDITQDWRTVSKGRARVVPIMQVPKREAWDSWAIHLVDLEVVKVRPRETTLDGFQAQGTAIIVKRILGEGSRSTRGGDSRANVQMSLGGERTQITPLINQEEDGGTEIGGKIFLKRVRAMSLKSPECPLKSSKTCGKWREDLKKMRYTL